MLVLTRRKGERVVIVAGDNEIEICLVHVKENSVRLGFEADQSVLISRKETMENYGGVQEMKRRSKEIKEKIHGSE